MKKRAWLIPILIVVINALAVAVRWSSLAEQLPAHFDLQGHASGTMARSVLLLYPLMGGSDVCGGLSDCPKTAAASSGICCVGVGRLPCAAFIDDGDADRRNDADLHARRAGDPASCRCRFCDGLASLPKSIG